MIFLRQFRAAMAIVALICFFWLPTANAQNNSLYDWQPCPDSMAAKGGKEPTRKWDLTVSPYVHHWNANPEHKRVNLFAIDSHMRGGRFCGLAIFTNSFGQPSAYAYIGRQWDNVFGNPKLFSKVSAGLIYGYKDKHQDKLAFNDLGVAPVIIPSLGYAMTPEDSAQVFVLGTAGLLFAYAHSF
jgi:hypothetical protein